MSPKFSAPNVLIRKKNPADRKKNRTKPELVALSNFVPQSKSTCSTKNIKEGPNTSLAFDA